MTSTNLSLDVAEFENMMSLDNPIQSSTATRWERKARQQVTQQVSSLSSSASQSDRYIPHRGGMNFDLNNRTSADDETSSNVQSEHAKLLLANTLESEKQSRVLAFKNKAPTVSEDYQSSMRVLYSVKGPAKKEASVKTMRHIPSAPVRVLDAPDMLDDYCKNLLYLSEPVRLSFYF